LGALVIDIVWTWGEAFLRWLHVIAGIAWIGSSFYFMHLDSASRSVRGCCPRPMTRPLEPGAKGCQ
jgi:uncharacterized membrane protein